MEQNILPVEAYADWKLFKETGKMNRYHSNLDVRYVWSKWKCERAWNKEQNQNSKWILKSSNHSTKMKTFSEMEMF